MVPNLLRLLMLLAFAATAAWGVNEYRRDNRAAVASTQAPAPSTPAPALELTLPDNLPPPLQDFTETLTRPLFLQDRVPYEAPEVAASTVAGQPLVQAPTPTTPPPNVRLTAVVMRQGRHVAFLRATQDGETTQLALGESLDNWRLVSVSDDGVTLEQAGQTVDLKLREFDAPPEPGASTPRARARTLQRPLPRTLLPRGTAPGSQN